MCRTINFCVPKGQFSWKWPIYAVFIYELLCNCVKGYTSDGIIVNVIMLTFLSPVRE